VWVKRPVGAEAAGNPAGGIVGLVPLLLRQKVAGGGWLWSFGSEAPDT